MLNFRVLLLALAAVGLPAHSFAQPPSPPPDSSTVPQPATAPLGPAAAPQDPQEATQQPAPAQPAPGQPAPGQPAPAQPAPAQPAPAQPAPAQPGQPAPAQDAAAAQPVYYTRSFDFEDVDISRVAAQLRSFGIPVPLALEGTVTVNISVSIPITQLTNGRAYRVQGTIRAPRLRVDNYRFGDLTARLSIENGVLRLTGLEGVFLDPLDPTAPQSPQPPLAPPLDPAEVLGSFAGTASAQLLPLGQFTADLRVQNVDVRFLDQFLAEPLPEVAGVVNGTLQLAAPVDQIAQVESFTGTAELASPRLSYGELSLAEATANLQLRQGVARLTALAGQLMSDGSDVPQGTVNGTATLQIAPLGQLSIEARVDSLDLALLTDLAELPAGQVAGSAILSISATAPAEQAEQIATWSGEGQFHSDRLVLRPLAGEGLTESAAAGALLPQAGKAGLQPRVIDAVRGEFSFDSGTFRADPLVLEFEGAPLQGRLSVRLAETAEQERGWTAAVRTESAQVADLLELLAGAAPADTSGTVSLDIEATGPLQIADAAPPQSTDSGTTEAAAASDAAAESWRVGGTIAGQEIYIAGFHVGPLAHQLQATPRRLALEPLASADVAELLLRSLQADYVVGDDALTLENLALQGWNGSLSGEAVWSLADAGRHRAVIDWSDLNFVFRGDAVLALESTLETTTSGHIEWTAPAGQLEHPAAHDFNLRAQLTEVQTDQLELGSFAVAVDAQALPWQLRGSGTVLDVPTEISATLQVAPAIRWEDLSTVPAQGSLVAGPFAVAPLLDRFSNSSDESDETGLQGTAAFRIDAETVAGGPPLLSAELAVEQLASGAQPIAQAFAAATGLVFADGRLRLTDLRGELTAPSPGTPPLEYRGRAVVDLAAGGELALELAAEGVDLAWTNPWMPDGLGPFDGSVQGTVRAAAPLDQLGRVAAWQGVAEVTSPQFRMEDLIIRAASAELVLNDAVLTADPITGIADGVALAATAAVELETDQGPGGGWEMRLQTGSARVEDVMALFADTVPAETSGFLSFDVLASGWAPTDAQDGGWRAVGELSGDAVVLAGVEVGRLRHQIRISGDRAELEPLETADVNRLQLTRFAADYAGDEPGWQLQAFRLEGWGGFATGNATWSGDPNGRHAAAVTWSDLRVPIPASLVAEEGPDLQLLTGGNIQWSAPSGELADPSAHRFTLDAQARDIRVGETVLGDLSVHIDATDPVWEVRGEGTLLNGPAEVAGTLDVSEADSWDQWTEVPAEGELAAGPLQIGDLFQLWQPEERSEPWSGTASLRWTIRSAEPAQPRSVGELRIDDLRFGNRDVIDRLRVEMATTSDRFDIRSLRGRYAGGRIEGSGRWALGVGPRQLAVRLTSIDASRALLPLVATSDEWFAGRLSGDLVIAGREALRVTGRMELRDGETFGIASRSVRANLRGSVALPSLRWALQLSDLQASRGRGRIVGRVQLEQSFARRDRVDLDSEFEATNLDFQDVLADLSGGGAPTFGSGSLTGVVTLSGRAIESAADLEGRIVGRLDGTDATAVPGLVSAEGYLGVLSLRNTEFNRGGIEARLRLGELQISDLWLSSDQLRVWANGDVSLRSGRLDIDAVAATGDFEQGNAPLLTLARTFALEAALPVSALTRANELLSNRVVQLSIGGTYRRPAVRVRPVGTLSENAARFFLREAAGVVLPGTGVGALDSNR